ncbi:MAG: hypothetical protein ACK4IX_04705 [Candidatus Sericytochromatia bacterium]
MNLENIEKIKEVYPTSESKLTFIKGLIFIIKADGIIHPKELELINTLVSLLDLSEEDKKQVSLISDLDDYDSSLKFDNKAQELFFIKEGFRMCLIDENYHPSEKELLIKIANDFGLSDLI